MKTNDLRMIAGLLAPLQGELLEYGLKSKIGECLREAASEIDRLNAESARLRRENHDLKAKLKESCEWCVARKNERDDAKDIVTALRAENEQLELERDAAITDFMNFSTQGSPNFAPFCAHKDDRCVNGRGWCAEENCERREWRGLQREEKA